MATLWALLWTLVRALSALFLLLAGLGAWAVGRHAHYPALENSAALLAVSALLVTPSRRDGGS